MARASSRVPVHKGPIAAAPHSDVGLGASSNRLWWLGVLAEVSRCFQLASAVRMYVLRAPMPSRGRMRIAVRCSARSARGPWRKLGALAVGLASLAASAVPATEGVTCRPRADWILPPALSLVRSEASSELPHPCSEGEVPLPVGYSGPKGSPGTRTAPGLRASTSSVSGITYHYAGVYQYVSGASGASAQWGQFQPTVASTDAHSLGEMWVGSSDLKQGVEVGWIVDPSFEGDGDSLPHLFVFHWVDGNPTCYDGCGWEQVSQSRYPGMVVALTREPQEVIYRYFNSAWWVWYQSEWIGFFPESLWTASFSSAELVEWYGEVAGAVAPKSQMGDGLLADEANAAFMTSLQVEDLSGESRLASIVSLKLTDPGAYELSVVDAGFRFGGPGHNPAAQCATCASLLANCGMVDDGCGSSLSCGTCVAPQTCGGGPQANVCALADGGMGGTPWTGGYVDAGTPDEHLPDAGSTAIGEMPQSSTSGCSSSGPGGSFLVAAFALSLLALGWRASRQYQ
jgi:hypothetical protein